MKFFLALFYIAGLSFAFCSLMGGGFMQGAFIEAEVFEAHPEIDIPEESASLACQTLLKTHWPSILAGTLFLAYFGICACLQAGSQKLIDLIGWGFLLLCSALSIYSGWQTLNYEDLSKFFGTVQVGGGVVFILIAGLGAFLSVAKSSGSSAAAQ